MDNYIYISSRKNLKEYLEDNFNNVKFISKTPSKLSLKKIIKGLEKNNIKQVIIEDYFVGIQNFIEKLNNLNIAVKVIWINGLATLNEEIELGNLLEVLNLLKNHKIQSLGFTQDNIYQVYADVEGVKKINLTVKEIKTSKSMNKQFISIYGDAYSPQSNYFNQLSALKFIDKYSLLVIDSKNIINRFCKFFNISYTKANHKFKIKAFRSTLEHIAVASCVEFSSLFDLFVIDSYNHGVPVVVGNNTLFFKGTELEEMVVAKSDDDVNEIAEKINFCLNNSKKIIEIYKTLKKKYDQKCKSLIKDFIKE